LLQRDLFFLISSYDRGVNNIHGVMHRIARYIVRARAYALSTIPHKRESNNDGRKATLYSRNLT